MSTTTKIAVGLSIASGALLAAWLLTGDRKEKTKHFVARRADTLKQVLKKEAKGARVFEDSEVHYI